MLPGFNTDFKYKGRVFHAQTEDNGLQNPVVVTLLYLKGTILSSKRTSYKELLSKENFQHELKELMKSQHRDIMKEVLTGNFDAGPVPAEAKTEKAEAAPLPKPAPPPPEARSGPKSLDDAIMEFLALSDSTDISGP